MKKVYVCSPLNGDVTRNIDNARKYAKYVFECGMAPVVPHFYATILDDSNPKERTLGMRAGKSLIWFCDELWVFGKSITSDMKEEIAMAKNLNIKVKFIL